MHWQVETWKCAQPREKSESITTGGLVHPKVQLKTKHQCGQVFYRREQFQAHLDELHQIKDPEYIRAQCKLRRVGRNGQRGFWCGFCQTVVSLKKRGLEAWDERFTHIDDEHFKKGEKVENWFPMDKEVPKGILDEEKQDTGSEGDDESGAYGSDVGDGSTSVDLPGVQDGLFGLQKQSQDVEKISGRTRKAARRGWFCCHCRNGPMSWDINSRCSNQGCAHMKCSRCDTEKVTQ